MSSVPFLVPPDRFPSPQLDNFSPPPQTFGPSSMRAPQVAVADHAPVREVDRRTHLARHGHRRHGANDEGGENGYLFSQLVGS